LDPQTEDRELAEEVDGMDDSYATTRHSSSIAEATLPRWQPNVSIPDLEALVQ
jgi:hypothetical protein